MNKYLSMTNHNKIRWISLYYSAYIYVGMTSAILGPSLLELVSQTNSSLQGLSIIFPARSGAYLLGSWMAGILFDRYRGHKVMLLGLLIMGAALGLIPSLGDPLGLVFILMAMGLAMGLVDVGCSSLLFRIPTIQINPAMNGLHFFFGLGAFLAPLILAGSLQKTAGIQAGFWGLGLVSLLVLVQFIRLPEPAKQAEEKQKNGQVNLSSPPNQALLLWVIALFFFAFVGVEVGYGDWLLTYSIRAGLADQKVAVLLTSVYWGVFTLGRLVSIPLAAKLKPNKLLLVDVTGSFLGIGLVFLFPGNPAMLWAGTILLGISLASIFPTMLTFADRLIPMTGKITSRFFISGSIGSMFLPWVIGRYVETIGPVVIIRVLFLTMLLASLMFIVLTQVAKKHPQR